MTFAENCNKINHKEKNYLTLKDNSKFSPPQICIPSSYAPISKKYFLSIANKPPACVGDLKNNKVIPTIRVLHCAVYEKELQFVLIGAIHRAS